ncbi:MAG: ABC transporter ATP-binding protein/permease [Bacilli bacterium]|nr:ABC transporter ATP-binding protein/permease [Bacilli bacterium]
MLEIKKVSKIYETAGFKQKALDEVSIKFRENEFVSILGQSGSGKTTLLNIVGGLDQYTKGDLIINGISTKEFKDRDWDTYRNHRVGFVFQSYNLIPHQTALQNVELALTLSGVSKEERRKRAKDALVKVGLEDHMNKRPNQMSGGQMQRIAIARALVNNPDILLADEPTGALDSETSIQVMELLKEIAKDKLVIMVTHNPDLAEEYSTRIIKLLDGKVVNDSNPLSKKEEEQEKKKEKDAKEKNNKTHMSFFTALSLSLNNLLTKKGRTILTAFAGSIGIIGIALIMSLSNGVQEYIKRVEEDTLSSYPLTIQKTQVDTSSMMLSLMGDNKDTSKYEEGKVYSNNIMTDVISTLASEIKINNLEDFKDYLESDKSGIKEYVSDIKYSYNLNLNLYKSNYKDKIVQVNPSTVLESLSLGDQTQNMVGLGEMNSWTELTGNEELLKTQYNLVAGNWPKDYNEVVLVVDEDSQVSDYALYSLGLLDQDELKEIMKQIMSGQKIEKLEQKVYDYEDIVGLKFKLVLNTDYYEKQGSIWVDKRDDEEYMKKVLSKAEEIEVVGIIRVDEESTISTTGVIGYTEALTEYTIKQINESEIAKEQKANKDVNVITGRDFSESAAFDMNDLSDQEKAYLASLSQEELAQVIASYTENASATYESTLLKLGIVDIENPDVINIYPKDFESKERIVEIIDKYNNKLKEEEQITYTDIVGVMMKSVSSIINTISYVLMAFVSISLVVSSIMISIITYISVLERTKEIGILRSIGASKKDISRVFNAETLIEGLVAGLLGIGVTLLLNIPINIIIKEVTNISNVSVLPIDGAIGLIIISVILTVLAGLIPSKMASKKDPVEALRTE